jgi:hypothetical protein
VVVVAAMTACGGSTSAGQESDPTEAASAPRTAGGSLNSAGPYYFLERDMRDCLFPQCGGVFYRLANFSTTLCADGETRDRCYAALLDTKYMDVAPEREKAWKEALDSGRALVRGTVETLEAATFGSLDVMSAQAGWIAGTTEGSAYSLAFNGVLCIKAPCFNVEATLLNHKSTTLVSSIGGEPGEMSRALKDVFNRCGALAAGAIAESNPFVDPLALGNHPTGSVGVLGTERRNVSGDIAFSVRSAFLPTSVECSR